MLRYLGKEPAECFDADGFFHTGDLGHVDERGEVHFEGRRTEMIKTGGANVSPAELEAAMRACEPVKLRRGVGRDAHPPPLHVVSWSPLKGGHAAPKTDTS